MSIAADLHALQDLDLALDRVLARLREIEEELEETEELRAAKQIQEDRTRIMESLKSRQSDLEWQVEEVRTKAAEVEDKLYGGKVSSPKELSDLDLDLKSLKLLQSKREDVLLAHLVESDDAAKELQQASSEYGEIESRWRAHHDELLQERDRLKPEEDELTVSRDQRAAGIDRSAISLYALLRERKGGLAVARVERGMCQGCRITLPAAILQKARGSGLVQCVSCERILLVN
jgi:predicted  nucleic acid-binding Zn-ribbon protein